LIIIKANNKVISLYKVYLLLIVIIKEVNKKRDLINIKDNINKKEDKKDKEVKKALFNFFNIKDIKKADIINKSDFKDKNKSIEIIINNKDEAINKKPLFKFKIK